MSIASTSALPSALPAPQTAQPSGGNAGPHAASAAEADSGFANALQQARQGARQREAQAERKADARRTERAANESRSPARTERPAAAAPQEAAERSKASPDATGSDAGSAASAVAPPEASRGAIVEAPPAPDTSLPAWLESALARAPAGSGVPGESSDLAGPGASDSPTGATGADRSATRRLAAGLTDIGRMPSADSATPGAQGGDPGAEPTTFAAAFADAAASPPERTAAAPAVSAPGLEGQQTASVASPATPGLTAASQAEAVERPIAPHVQSPEFAPALGAQLNILVKDGVSEARLHLNPAEMGPITVQIHIEGQTARVEMVAEHAATRQALEQSMPALAGALRDSGLTLAGGGVFEQARDPRQGEAEGRPARAGSAGAGSGSGEGIDAGLEPGRPARPPAGMVDVYA